MKPPAPVAVQQGMSAPPHASWKQRWARFKAAKAGERFQGIHRRQQQKHTRPVLHVALALSGVVLVVVGLVLMPAPGPGIPVVIAGGGLLAGQSLTAARALDGAEVGIRRFARWLRAKRKK